MYQSLWGPWTSQHFRHDIGSPPVRTILIRVSPIFVEINRLKTLSSFTSYFVRMYGFRSIWSIVSTILPGDRELSNGIEDAEVPLPVVYGPMNCWSIESTIHFCAGVLDPVDLVPILCTRIGFIPARSLNRLNLGVRGYVE